MNYILVDIDGTCANLNHRLMFVRGTQKNWAQFLDPAIVALDTPISGMKELIHLLAEKNVIFYVSGRSESLRATTLDWLEANGFPRTTVYMRADGDYRPDHVIKQEILDKLLALFKTPPVLVLDDRPQVIDMWKRNNIPVVAFPWHDDSPSRLPNRGLLTLMVGPSGAGKSTFLTQYVDGINLTAISDEPALLDFMLAGQPPRPLYILSSDILREQMFGDPRDQTHNAEVFEALHNLATAHLAAGDHVIIDATHLRRKDRLDAVALAQGGPVRYIVMDRPNKAPWHGNLDVVRKHEHMFASQLKDILAGDHLPNVTVFDARN